MSSTEPYRQTRFPWPQIAALVVGASLFLFGLGGFTVTGFTNFTAFDPMVFVAGITLNPLHNCVHLVVGLLGGACASGLRATAFYGWFLAIVGGLLAIYGFIVGDDASVNVFNLNLLGNLLHLAAAVVGIVIAVGAVRVAREDGWVVPRPGAPTPGEIHH